MSNTQLIAKLETIKAQLESELLAFGVEHQTIEVEYQDILMRLEHQYDIQKYGKFAANRLGDETFCWYKTSRK